MSPRILRLFCAALMTATLLSCSEEATPEYDRLKLQLLTKAFDAVHHREHELAISRLGKLPSSEFVQQMIKREQEGLVLHQVRTLTADGKLIDALNACKDGIVHCGRTGRLPAAENALKGMLAIRDYKAGRPYGRSVEFKKALAKLPAPKRFGNNPRYIRWLNGCRKAMQAVLNEERTVHTKRAIKELDDALLRGTKIGEKLTNLQTTNPTHPLLVAWRRKNTVDSGKLSDADRERLVLGLFRSRLATVDLALLPEVPTSPCGSFLNVARSLRNGLYLRSLRDLRNLKTTHPHLDVSPLRPLLRTALKNHKASMAPTDIRDFLLRFK